MVRRVLGIADREAFFALARRDRRARSGRRAARAPPRRSRRALDARDLAEGVVRAHPAHADPQGGSRRRAISWPLSGEDLKRLQCAGRGLERERPAAAAAARVRGVVADARQPAAARPSRGRGAPDGDARAGRDAGASCSQRLEALEQPPGRRAIGAPRAAPPPAERGPRRPRPRRPASARSAPVRAHAPRRARAREPGARPTARVASRDGAGRGAVRAASSGALGAGAALAAVARRRDRDRLARGAALERDGDRAELALTTWSRRSTRRKRMLGAFLEESRVHRGSRGSTLVIAMDDLHRAVVEEKENRALHRRRGAARVRPRRSTLQLRRRSPRRAPPQAHAEGRTPLMDRGRSRGSRAT